MKVAVAVSSEQSPVLADQNKLRKCPRKMRALKLAARPLTVIERNSLIGSHREDARRLAKSLLRSWKQFMEPDELYSHVDAALCEAAASYRPDLGARFFTHAYYFIKGQLAKTLSSRRRDADSLESLDAIAPALTDRLFTRDSERELSAEELLITNLTQLRPDEILLRKEVRSLAAVLPEALSIIEQEVIAAFYYRGETIADVSRRLGYSRGHISRIHTRAVRALRRAVMASIQ